MTGKKEFVYHIAALFVLPTFLFSETLFHGLAFRGTGDAWLNTLPLVKFALSSLASGFLPMWNPYLSSGYNFMAESTNVAFDPSAWLLIPFLDSNEWFFHFYALRVYLLLVGSGVFAYIGLRRHFIPGAALFGSITLMLSPAAMWALSSPAQIPSLFFSSAALCILLSEQERREWRTALFLTATIGGMYLLGTLMASSFFWLSLLVIRFHLPGFTPRKILLFFGATFLGIGLSAMRLAPMIVEGIYSNRIAQDSSAFMKTGTWAHLARSVIPEYLGWNQTQIEAPFFALPLECANLSYLGVFALMAALITFSNGKFLRKHLVLVLSYAVSVLILVETPFLYQSTANLLSPLFTGGVLYVNFTLPLIMGLLAATCVDQFAKTKLSETDNSMLIDRLLLGLLLSSAALVAYASYAGQMLRPSHTSLWFKLVAVVFLVGLTFKALRQHARIAYIVLLLLAVTITAIDLEVFFSWLLSGDFPNVTATFMTNSFLGLIAAVLLLAFDGALRKLKLYGPWNAAAFVAPALVAIALLIATSSTAKLPLSPDQFPAVPQGEVSRLLGLIRFAIMGLLALIVANNVVRRKWPLSIGIAILCFLQGMDLLGHGRNYMAAAAMPFKSVEEVFPPMNAQIDINSRVASNRVGWIGMADNLPAWYGIRTAAGYQNFIGKEYAELAEAGLNEQFPSIFRIPTLPFDSRLAELTATNSDLDPKLNLTSKTRNIPRAAVVYRTEVLQNKAQRLLALKDPSFPFRDIIVLNEGTPVFDSTPAIPAQVQSDSNNSIVIDADTLKPGFLFLRDAFNEGWSAKIAGNQAAILRADHAFMAVAIPAGKSRIEFSFWPKGFTAGLIISALSLLALLSLPICCNRRQI